MPTRALTDTEIKKVVLILKPNYRLLFLTGLYTGFRISELLSLTWNDVTHDRVTVQRRNMKGKVSTRSVPIHPELKPYLKRPEYVSPLSKLFPFCRQMAHRTLTNAFKDIGIQGKLGTHCMRKTLAKKVYEASHRDLILTQKALGHVSVASTQAYLNVSQDAVDSLILAL